MSSPVRETEAFGLSPLPFFLRSLCFGFNAVGAFQTRRLSNGCCNQNSSSITTVQNWPS